MDVVRAEADLNAYLDRRARSVPEARPGQERANELERLWAASDLRFQVRRRLQLNAAWYCWHSRLADHFGKLAEEHAAKAEKLLEIDPRKETA